MENYFKLFIFVMVLDFAVQAEINPQNAMFKLVFDMCSF